MNTAEYIRETVTMNDICRKYGLTMNRAGFTSCPFHQEKTASLKIFPDKRGWYCFGCGQGGSVIDFVEKFFNVNFKEAVKIINRDFNLGLTVSKKTSYREREIVRRKISEAERLRREAAELRKAQQAEYDNLISEYVRCDLIIRYLKPKSHNDILHDIYVEAMHKMPIIEFRLDCIKG